MIYTSYFGKLKKLPITAIPISICGKAPDWYTGLQYKKLAPKYGFFMEWKKNHDNNYYIEEFNKQVLSQLNPREVVLELTDMALRLGKPFSDIILICYEKPEDFCHRHLVADWLTQKGFKVKEYA